MAGIQTVFGTRTALNTNSPNSLASATYLLLGTITKADETNDVVVEVTLTPGTVSGNKQALLFLQASLNATDYTSGPVSGTTTTDEPNLYWLGAIPLNTNSTAQKGTFSVKNSQLGYVPKSFKVILKNDSGAALASSGCDAYYSEVSNPIA